MKKGIVILIGCVAALTAFTWFGSKSGWGVPQPVKEPLSIREESTRDTRLHSGRYRTRYFLRGGGPARGK